MRTQHGFARELVSVLPFHRCGVLLYHLPGLIHEQVTLSRVSAKQMVGVQLNK
jgi:hypothetical protein